MDNTSRLQLFGGESPDTEFLNFQMIEGKDIDHDRLMMLKLTINLGEKYFIHKRQVYNFMDFLGDAGGILGSMTIIGSTLHYLFVRNEVPLMLMKHYFKINEK